MPETTLQSIPAQPPTRPTATRDEPLWALSQSLEASFLSEMLTSAGLGETRSTFGGGVGEDQFASFLVSEQARAMVNVGGIGLSESIYRSLIRTKEAV